MTDLPEKDVETLARLETKWGEIDLSEPRSWRDGLDLLAALLDDCGQGDDGQAVRIWAVRAVIRGVRNYEDDTDESIRSALYEDWLIDGGGQDE